MKKEKLQFKAFYAHPVSEVWEAITDPEHLREWLVDASFEAKEGEAFQWKGTKDDRSTDPLENQRCRIQIVEKEKFLSYQMMNPNDGGVSIVSWTLEEKESGTEVTLDHERLTEEALKPHPQVIMQVAPVISLEEYRMKKLFARLMAELEFALEEVA